MHCRRTAHFALGNTRLAAVAAQTTYNERLVNNMPHNDSFKGTLFENMPRSMLITVLQASEPHNGTISKLVAFFKDRGLGPKEAVQHVGIFMGFIAEMENIDHHEAEVQAWLCVGAAIVQEGRSFGLTLGSSPSPEDKHKANELADGLIAHMMRRTQGDKPN